jgi:hypothetical protein
MHGTLSTGHQIVVAGRWAITDGGIQWILQRRAGAQWQNISFVRSTKNILARCLRESGATPAEASAILDSLPDRHATWSEGYGIRFKPEGGPSHVSPETNAAIPTPCTEAGLPQLNEEAA